MNLAKNILQAIRNSGAYSLNSCRPQVIQVTHGEIEFCRFGQGKPLILIMGYAAALNGWNIHFLYELAKTREVIVLNNRNVGASHFPNSNTYTIQDLANDVKDLIKSLGFHQVALGGISMGGMIAQQFASLYPEQLSHLILINTLPPGNLAIRPSTSTINILQNLNNGRASSYWQILKLLFPSPWYLSYLPITHFKPKGNKIFIPRATINSQQRAVEAWATQEQAKIFLLNITTPTLICCGEADEMVPAENSKVIKQYLPNAQLRSYPNGGHIMIYQYPLQLAWDINNFLNHSEPKL